MNLKAVSKPIRKKDAMALVTGQPVYMDDMIPGNCLIVKVLRSPHANAVIEDIEFDRALKIPGIEAVYTWKDVPDKRFTMAGQTYPEPSPYDRLILDRHLRYVGDPVAIVAGDTEKARCAIGYWKLCWTFGWLRIMLFWCILRKTGNLYVR